jgi:hypothetical protein
VPFSNYGLDHLVSQELSKLSRCGAPEVTDSFPESRHWVSNFVLNSFLRFQLPPEMKRFRFSFLRRAEAAFIEYDYAREALSEYAANSRRKPYSLYFRALHHFEMTIAMLWQAYSFVRQFTGLDPYKNGDSSRYERLAKIYNDSRYFDHKLPPDHLHHIWISNDGIHTAKYSLSFEELKESLEEVGQFADSISSELKPREEKSQ